MAEQLDPEMLKNLDLLLDLDVAESEDDWDAAEQMDAVAQAAPAQAVPSVLAPPAPGDATPTGAPAPANAAPAKKDLHHE